MQYILEPSHHQSKHPLKKTNVHKVYQTKERKQNEKVKQDNLLGQQTREKFLFTVKLQFRVMSSIQLQKLSKIQHQLCNDRN